MTSVSEPAEKNHRNDSAPRSRARSVAGSALFFLVAPATVAGWIPYAITGWHVRPPLIIGAERAVGGVILALATLALVECFARFALVGRGTPAPIVPTDTLVVSGLYKHTRNPMYVAVVAAIVGQALLFGAPVLFGYAAAVWLVFHLFVVGYEEPTLGRQFKNYDAYRAHVPRWLPRLHPWPPSPKADV